MTVLHVVYSFRYNGNHPDNLLFIGLLSEQYRLNGWLPSLSILRKQFFFEEIIFEECRDIYLLRNLS
jgi:hypothetical protein